MFSKPVNIIIVDDHPLVRQGMTKVIEKEENLNVIHEAGNAEEALKLISKNEPDLAIIDISLETEASGIDLVKALRDRYSKIKTMVLSMHDENIYAERALRAGARGYVTKKEGPAVIVDAIKAVMDGELYLSSRMSAKIIDKLLHVKDRESESLPDLLSDREFEVFQMIGKGMGTGDIAKKLNLSVNTIESHRKKIKLKLGIEKASELVKYSVEWNVSQRK
ncbi:response regulator [Spirochaetota bacterium]